MTTLHGDGIDGAGSGTDGLGVRGLGVDGVGEISVHGDGIGVAGQSPLDRESPEPLHAQLKRVLLAQIHDGDFAAGDKLPTEMELVDQYSVSRITVRRTLGELAVDGYLERRPGSGTTIRPRIYWDRRSQRLYGFEDELRALGIEAHTRIVSVDEAACSGEEAEALGTRAGEPVLRVAQRAFVDGEPMSVADVSLYLPGSVQVDVDELCATGKVYPYLERRHGIIFHQANKTLAAQLAGEIDAPLLGIAPSDPVMVAEVTSSIDVPRTAMFIRARYRGDRYRFYVALSN